MKLEINTIEKTRKENIWKLSSTLLSQRKPMSQRKTKEKFLKKIINQMKIEAEH